MKYIDARNEIRSGDLLAWPHRGWGSWYDFKIQLVRLFTRSEYSHVGIAWRSGGRVWAIESVTPRVRVVPLSNLLPCYRVALKRPWNLSAEEYALSFVGNENYAYSPLEAVKAFFGANDPRNSGLECAEFVKLVYEKLGLDLAGRATPSDVVNAVLASGGELTFLEA